METLFPLRPRHCALVLSEELPCRRASPPPDEMCCPERRSNLQPGVQEVSHCSHGVFHAASARRKPFPSGLSFEKHRHRGTWVLINLFSR